MSDFLVPRTDCNQNELQSVLFHLLLQEKLWPRFLKMDRIGRAGRVQIIQIIELHGDLIHNGLPNELTTICRRSQADTFVLCCSPPRAAGCSGFVAPRAVAPLDRPGYQSLSAFL